MKQRCVRTLAVVFLAVGAALGFAAESRTIVVGAQGDVARLAEAAQLAHDGDTIVVEPGDYVGDVAVWPQSDLTIRARGCCVRLVAGGASAEGKAIWVVKGDRVTIEGIAFEGARVPAGNGAGIRHEGGRLTVRGCRFTGHQMGLLTSNDPAAELVVERSEFFGNHRLDEGDGGRPAHQVYVGRIARFELRESHVHSGAVGHLVKSRARVNLLAYNLIADGPAGRASYEVEFPEGGDALLIGNVVAQGPSSENTAIIAYGAEGRSEGVQRLILVHNTIVDAMRPQGQALRIWPGPGVLSTANNLLIGSAAIMAGGFGARDFAVISADVPAAANGDYRLARESRVAGRAHDLRRGAERLPVPDRAFVQPLYTRPLVGAVRQPGALQGLRRRRQRRCNSAPGAGTATRFSTHA